MESLLEIEQQFEIILDGLERSIETQSRNFNNPYSSGSIEYDLYKQGFQLYKE
jgi:hypothetical protein